VLYAAPLGIGNREEYARLVGFFDHACGGPYRQTTSLLNLVDHLHRFSAPSVQYPLCSRRLHAASLAIRQLAHSLPSKPIPAVVRGRALRIMWGVDERASWPPKRSEAEQRRRDTALLYDLEIEYRKIDWGNPAYVYDEEKDLFRFWDGRFAFSREHAYWGLLRKRGRIP